jgi:predicted metal-dependent enzyme (double-stranded beta helix superfamily)
MKYIKTNFVYSPNVNYDRHTHEIQGIVDKIEDKELHYHLFSTVTGEAIPMNQDHIHEIKFVTDSFNGHSHEYSGKTSGAIKVGDKHVHFLKAETSINQNHKHNFNLATFFTSDN